MFGQIWRHKGFKRKARTMKVRVQLLAAMSGNVSGDEHDIREVSAKSALALVKADMVIALADEPGEVLDIETLEAMAEDEAAIEAASKARADAMARRKGRGNRRR